MNRSDRIKTQELQMTEWRRKYDSLSNNYDKVRGRSITLLTIQLGVTGYLITQLETIIKPQLYGQIFFVFAAVMAVIAIALSIRNYQVKRNWSSPVYTPEIDEMNRADSYTDAIDVALKDYQSSYDHNKSIYEPAARRLNNSLFLYIAAVIMLLVLNFAK